jgi:hypothetical protein
MIPTLLIVAVALSATGGYVLLRARPRQEEPMHHFECPFCRRRLRYRGDRAGHKGMCPLCRKHLVFPVMSGAVSARPARGR